MRAWAESALPGSPSKIAIHRAMESDPLWERTEEEG